MSDQKKVVDSPAIDLTNPEVQVLLNETKGQFKGHERRRFMAHVVQILGHGGQLKAEQELGWDRKTIIKGTKELTSGIICADNFSGRGRKLSEEHLPNLLEDIKEILNPVCQTDPTFRTPDLYSPLTAEEVRRRLIEDKGYQKDSLPTHRTILKKMDDLGFKLKKVAKSKPKKKIPETDAIFEHVHHVNKIADESDGVIRISIDAKANVNVGPFSRGGYNRCGAEACDHDFAPDTVLKPFGIHLPALGENYFYFTESNITADFIWDSIEDLWPSLKSRFNPHTLVINSDNGPENGSRRSQFINRLVEFVKSEKIDVELVYYPPYHSKYNPIERVWGGLERHWNGEILCSVDKVIGLCKTMTWKGKNAVVKLVNGVYEKGVKLSKKAMEELETYLIRKPKLEKWAVEILCFE